LQVGATYVDSKVLGTKALRKPPSDSRFALLSEHGGSLLDSFRRSEMSEQR